MDSFFWKLSVVILFAFLYSIASCNRELESELPLIQTGEVVEIDSTGVTLFGSLLSLGDEPVLDFGFIWSRIPDPSILSSNVITLANDPETGVFSFRLTSAVGKGEDYYVKSFIRNELYTTYGREVVFTSQGGSAPLINDFFPAHGNLNDTVTIIGESFIDYPRDIGVYFGVQRAKLIYLSSDSIQVQVPVLLDSQFSNITVSVVDQEAVSSDPFELISPEITSIDTSGTFGSEIEVRGANFLSNPGSLFAWIGGYKAPILEKEMDRLRIRVPSFLETRSNQVTVEMNNIIATSEQEFSVEMHVLDDFTPKNANTLSFLTLTGSNFCPRSNRNIVTIGGRECNVTEASNNELKVYLSSQFGGNYSGRTADIEVRIMDESLTYADSLHIEDPWFRLSEAPLTPSFIDDKESYSQVKCFVHEDKAYVGLNMLSDFWLYNPGNNSWERLKDFPGNPRNMGAGFVHGDKIFFGTGSDGQKDLNDWWEYDIPGDRWTQKNDFAGLARSGAVAFQYNGEGFLGTGYQKHGLQGNFQDIWKYMSETDEWAEHAFYPLPQLRSGIAVPNSSGVYIGLGEGDEFGHYKKTAYLYDPSSDNWEIITNFPSDHESNPIAFEMNDRIYIINRDAVHSYDESTSNWLIDPAQIRLDVKYGIGFSSKGIAYVGLGSDNQMWEFDPSR